MFVHWVCPYENSFRSKMSDANNFAEVSIIDYGAGNIGSIVNMIKKLGGTGKLVHTPKKYCPLKNWYCPVWDTLIMA
jgi:hypothetical protein